MGYDFLWSELQPKLCAVELDYYIVSPLLGNFLPCDHWRNSHMSSSKLYKEKPVDSLLLNQRNRYVSIATEIPPLCECWFNLILHEVLKGKKHGFSLVVNE